MQSPPVGVTSLEVPPVDAAPVDKAPYEAESVAVAVDASN